MSQVIEEAVRRDLGLDALERLSAGNDMTEEDATALAVDSRPSTPHGLAATECGLFAIRVF